MVLHYMQLFFIYSFIGFLWETIWTLIVDKELVKRGFLNGPILPIYGFGALIIIMSVHSYENNTFMIYFIGMVAATTLELVTGFFMEKALHVRYWDYDERPLNFHGYICARSSLFWGALSIVLVKYVNEGIEDYISNFSLPFINHITVIFVFIFLVDLSFSLKEAINLKHLIHYGEKLSDYSEQLKMELQEKSEEKKEELMKIFENSSANQAIEDLEFLREKGTVRFENFLSELIENKKDKENKIKIKALNILENIEDLETKERLNTLVENIYKKRAIRLLKFKRSALRSIKRNRISYRKRP